MITKKMYIERKGNIAAFRGCSFNCCYCAFRNTLSRSKCQQDREFKPHAHLEVLNKRPPPTKEGEFLTIGMNGDISFLNIEKGELLAILDYCCTWKDRIFLLQTKNPEFFLNFICPENVILGTTLETNRFTLPPNPSIHGSYRSVSEAPSPDDRFYAMHDLTAKKVLTIEPILDFDLEPFANAIINLKPEWVWVGYDSKPYRNHLPEPTLEKTEDLIKQLIDNGISVRQKLIRKAWFEGAQ